MEQVSSLHGPNIQIAETGVKRTMSMVGRLGKRAQGSALLFPLVARFRSPRWPSGLMSVELRCLLATTGALGHMAQ